MQGVREEGEKCHSAIPVAALGEARCAWCSMMRQAACANELDAEVMVWSLVASWPHVLMLRLSQQLMCISLHMSNWLFVVALDTVLYTCTYCTVHHVGFPVAWSCQVCLISSPVILVTSQ